MNKYIIVILCCAITLLLSSCAGQAPLTNLSPAYLVNPVPNTEVEKDPDADFGNYKTFALVYSKISSPSISSETNPIKIKQVAYFIRNIFEMFNYQYVSHEAMKKGSTPDLLIVFDASNQYHDYYVPPTTRQELEFTPGKYSETTSTNYGSIYDSKSGSSLLDYDEFGSSTTFSPGQLTTKTVPVAGYMVGHYYPTIGIKVYDHKNKQLVWSGWGSGCSDNPDIRVADQFVIMELLFSPMDIFPIRRIPAYQARGLTGMIYLPMTTDGNSYFPTVLWLIPKSPSELSGIKQADMIIAVNGKSTLNMTMSELRPLLDGEPGTTKSLTIKRVALTMTIIVGYEDVSSLDAYAPKQ